MITIGQLTKQDYTIDGQKCQAVVDHGSQTITVRSTGFNKEYPLDDYDDFDGTMRDFIKSKVISP